MKKPDVIEAAALRWNESCDRNGRWQDCLLLYDPDDVKELSEPGTELDIREGHHYMRLEYNRAGHVVAIYTLSDEEVAGLGAGA